MNESTFEVKIDSVNKIECVQIHTFDAEKVFLNQIKIPFSKGLTTARILVFDFSLNSGILNNIEE